MTASTTDAQYGSKVIASDRRNYWRYYGLHRDPFMPIVEDNNFFLPARWEQYFDLLQYLSESTNVLLTVTGLKGSGKTTFMRQFIAQANDNSKVCRLVGSAVLTPEQLSSTLIKDFNLAKPTLEASEEYWESFCHHLQASSQPYLLVIDDAHRLPQETLTIILNLIKQQSEHQMRLHVLLIGELQLTGLLQALNEGETDRELIHSITLEPLNLQETEAYIKYRLLSAGLPGGLPLRPTDMARVYKLSEGVPGRINAVARQVLIDVMQQRQLYGFAHFIRTRRTQFLGGAVLLIILLGLAFALTKGAHDPAFRLYKLLFSKKIPQPEEKTFTATPRVTTTNTSINTNNAKAIVMPTAIMNKENNPEQWYASKMVNFNKTSATAAPSTNTLATKITNPITPPQIQTTAAKFIAKPITKPLTEPAVSTVPTPPTAPIAATNTHNQSPITTPPATATGLLTFDSPVLSNTAHYTLQLIGVSSVAAVNKFIKQNQLGDQAYYYHTNFRSKDWYVVVYGDYTTRSAAQTALSALSEGVRGLNPWPRSMKSVLESMRHNHSAQTAGIENQGIAIQ